VNLRSIDDSSVEVRPPVRVWFIGVRSKLTQGELGNVPVILGLAAVWIYFQLRNDKFLSAGNLTNLMLQIAAVGTISIGVVLVLLLGEIDLSVGVVSGFCAAVMTVLNTRHGWGAPLAIIGGLVAGALVGTIQGFWVTRFRVPAFVVTLAGLLAWQGALLEVLGKEGSINITDQGILNVANTFYGKAVTWIVAIAVVAFVLVSGLVSRRRRLAADLPAEPLGRLAFRVVIVAGSVVAAAIVFGQDRGLPLAVVIFVGLVVIVDTVLRRTRFGRHVYAVGGNTEAARRAGIKVERVRLIVFVLASTLAAMGGILAASRNLAVTQSSGSSDVLLDAIAGAVIGGVSLFGGRGTAWSALLGALVIGSIRNGMTLLSVSSSIRFIVTGVVLLLAATIDAVSRRGRASAGRG
jgi:D-xylose transport system permease protein